MSPSFLGLGPEAEKYSIFLSLCELLKFRGLMPDDLVPLILAYFLCFEEQ